MKDPSFSFPFFLLLEKLAMVRTQLYIYKK